MSPSVAAPRRRPDSRNTWQRETILRALEGAGCHLTAEEIHRRARGRTGRVGLATVYRTLEAFVGTGLVEPVYLGDGRVRYGLATDHHDHLVCIRCGQWEPLERCLVSQAPGHVASGFRVTGHRLELHGYCAGCQRPSGVAG